jgi:hypothetical protein
VTDEAVWGAGLLGRRLRRLRRLKSKKEQTTAGASQAELQQEEFEVQGSIEPGFCSEHQLAPIQKCS